MPVMITVRHTLLTRSIFVVSLLGHIGCQPETKEPKAQNIDAQSFTIDISEALENKKEVQISEIAKSIKYVPLETLPGCLLGDIRKIALSDSSFFVSDSRKLLKFSIDGSFIKQIGSVGRGPGEYSGIADFEIEEHSDFIFITDPNKKSILNYAIDGSFINETNHNLSGSQFVLIDSTRFAIYTTEFLPQSDSIITSLVLTDISLNPIVQFKAYYQQTGFWSMGHCPLYRYNNNLYYKENFNDTLYCLAGDKLEPYLILSLGSYQLPPNLSISNARGINELQNAINEVDEKLHVYKLVESKHYLFTQLLYGVRGNLDKSLQIYVSKNELMATALLGKGFTDDLNHGEPFWPIYIYKDSLGVDFINPYETDLDQLMIHLNSKISENDNPILVLAELKD